MVRDMAGSFRGSIFEEIKEGIPVGAGAERSGVGTLASPWEEGKCSRDQDEGDASVPTPRIIHPRPYGYEDHSQLD